MNTKTRKNNPTACRGLNKTNCIFPCKLVRGKVNEHMVYCHSAFKRHEKKAKTKKELMKIKKVKVKTMKRIKSAKKDIEKGTKKIETATQEMDNSGILSNVRKTLTSLFVNTEEKPAKVEEEPIKIEEPTPIQEEIELVKEEEPEPEPIQREEIEKESKKE
jgi:hypothetical protein